MTTYIGNGVPNTIAPAFVGQGVAGDEALPISHPSFGSGIVGGNDTMGRAGSLNAFAGGGDDDVNQRRGVVRRAARIRSPRGYARAMVATGVWIGGLFASSAWAMAPTPRSLARRQRLGTTGLVVTISLLTADLAQAATVSSGQGHASLVPAVNAAVDALMSHPDTRVAGMTVAVSRNGRLLLNKGYGHANLANLTQMQPHHRSKIGSVSKAVVTGPSAWKLMMEKDIDPANTKLYGAAGVLGTAYAGEQDTAHKRFSPIVSMAIGTGDKVYTWYADQTYSVGTSTSLGQVRQPYQIPLGRKPNTIRGIDISKNGTVFTWYDDYTMSRGTPGNLGVFETPTFDAKGNPTKPYSLAPGRSSAHVIDMAIAKSNDKVYVWYDDGTVSSGNSTDLDAYRPLYPFQTWGTQGATRYNIRAFGINQNDKTHAWYTSGLLTHGSTDIPYKDGSGWYVTPTVTGAPNFKDWYSQITLQHMLDHKAGLPHSGDGAGASRRWGVPEEALTYEQSHSYMLLTRELKSQPGTATSYSNHGFGLWTLMVPKLAGGKSYRDYATQNYLAPLGLTTKFKPESVTYDVNMSRGYGYNAETGAFALRNSGDSLNGLAAGGWTASAESVLRVTKHLVTTYPFADVDKMGWSNAGGRLWHNGIITGGTAYVALFPQGHLVDGADVSKVHVALASNTEVSASLLAKLADTIATAVSEASVPATYDLWLAFNGG